MNTSHVSILRRRVHFEKDTVVGMKILNEKGDWFLNCRNMYYDINFDLLYCIHC
jgi:hypothetical protein